MAAPSLSAMFLVGVDILRTVRKAKTKTILAQIGNVAGDTVDSDEVEWWQQVGFASRPRKAETGSAAAQAFVVRRGDHDAAIASRDLRGQELAGQLEDGETCVYATEGQARILLKKDGTVSLFTTAGNDASGTGITLNVKADGSIEMASQHGGITIKNDAITVLSATGAGVKLDANGAAVLGSSVTLGGGLNPASGVMTYYTALGGIVPYLTSFASAVSGLAGLMTPIINGTTASPTDKTNAIAGWTALVTAAAALTTAFSNPLTSYSKVVSATE